MDLCVYESEMGTFFQLTNAKTENAELHIIIIWNKVIFNGRAETYQLCKYIEIYFNCGIYTFYIVTSAG